MKRNTHLFFVFCLLLFFRVSFAQITFQKSYGGAYGNTGGSGTSTFDGGYIITGSANNSSGITDVSLIKTDSIADTIWTKTYGGLGTDIGRSVIQTSDSGYAVLGITFGFGAGGADMCFIKTDANGNMLWNKTYGWLSQDFGFSVRQTFDGGYVISGEVDGLAGSSLPHIYLLKTNAIGDTLWTRIINAQIGGSGYCVIQTADSGFVLTGYTGIGTLDVCLAKLNSSGTLLWIKTYGGTEDDVGLSVEQTTDGGFIISAQARSFGGGGNKAYLLKTDSTGALAWSKTYAGVGGSSASSVQQTNDGGYVMAGYLGCQIGDWNVNLIKTDALGDTLWTRTFGGTGDEWGSSVKQIVDGGYIIAGATNSFVSHGEIYLIKTDSNGISGCNESNCSVVVSNPPTQEATLTNSVASGGIVTVPVINSGSGGGFTTLCFNAALSEITNSGEIYNIYPNPSNGNFSITSNKIMNLKIIIYNTFGETVYSEEVKNTSVSSTKQILLQATEGIYFIKMIDGEKYFCKKIIIAQD